MDVEIISTGTELLLGDILNTSFQLLSRTLNDAGFSVLYQSTVGDNQKRLLAALSIAQTRAQIHHPYGRLRPHKRRYYSSDRCRFSWSSPCAE